MKKKPLRKKNMFHILHKVFIEEEGKSVEAPF
jgi:hypothetical protein